MKTFIRRYLAPMLLSLASCAFIADAQVVNPSQPATGVPLAGSGIAVAGQTVSINYGVANSPFTGNMSVGGTLTAGTFAPTNITVSGTATVGTLAATTITASGNAAITGTVSGSNITPNVLTQTAAIYTTAATSLTAVGTAQTVDSFPVATFRSSQYVVQVTQGSTYQVSEVLVLTDGTNTYLTTYGLVSSTGTAIASISSTVTGGNLVLSVTFVSSATAGSAKLSANRVLI